MSKRSKSKRWKKTRQVSRGIIAWRLLKGIIFIVCLTLFCYQSAQFLHEYYKYPTTTKIEFTYPKEFELPAITFCNQNSIKRSKFCAKYPNLCERPSNITEACEIEPSACKDNTSNLVIPKLGFLANNSGKEVSNAAFEIFYSGNTNKQFWEEWSWHIKTGRKMKPVFIYTPWGAYLPCFADNLLLNSTDEPKKIDLDQKFGSHFLPRYDLYLRPSEEMVFGTEPTVFYSIHSPFVPVNPLEQGNILKLGHKYNIYLKLEEENLLTFPYVTDCTVYEDTWKEGNPQRPRSQEMCKDLCFHSIFDPSKNMLPQFEMLEYPVKLCFDNWKCKISSEDKEILERCKRNCKPSCRKLKYTSTITESALDKTRERIFGKNNLEYDNDRDQIQVDIFLGDRQVVVNRHFPVYDTGHLFSYIGGLMGCWLGVSIWAFAGIAENVCRRALQWMEQIKRYFKKTSQARHAVFTTRRSNVPDIKIL